MQEFPKAKYPSDPDKQPCVVHDAEAEAALGAGWSDKPAAAPAKPAPVAESRQDAIDAQVAAKRDHLDRTAPAAIAKDPKGK